MNIRKNISRSAAGLASLVAACIPAAIPLAQGAAVGSVNTSQPLAARPLAAYEHGQAMMQQAMSSLSPDINFKFLDKTYENDQYTNVAGQKVRTSCIRFKSTSGFQFRTDPAKFKLTTQGLRVEQNIARINVNGLTLKFQLGPCVNVAAGFGVLLSDLKVVYQARPMISFDTQGFCRVAWNEDPDSLRIAIGDLNIIGVQNDIDKLGKDAVREALNRVFKTAHEVMRNDLTKISVSVCGNQKRNPLLR